MDAGSLIDFCATWGDRWTGDAAREQVFFLGWWSLNANAGRCDENSANVSF